MTDTFDLQSITLPTGVTLDVVVAGDPANPPIILLHGFPESHRTWRHIIPDLARDHFVLAPDQRGYARSSKPEGVENYTPDKIVADLLALADHFDINRFTLVGHDWGGAVAWMAALQHPNRVRKLVIINAPHPFVFQKTMFDDRAQREASQYIRAFRNPDIERHIDSIGLSTFFDTSFMRHTDAAKIADEKPVYLAQWGQPGALTAMLNWYRASAIQVPAMDEEPPRPAFLDVPFPPLPVPTLVIWGLGDKALLPSQLDGLDKLVPGVRIEKVDAGHFVPWENPAAVLAAMRDWGGVSRELSSAFFARDVETVARALLGVTMLVDGVGGKIVETEAYAPHDPASHTYRGVTARNAVMFGPPGRAYVYRIYGLHWCVNMVCAGDTPGSAVLIRAVEPTAGLDTMRLRRGMEDIRLLCSGPGKLTQAMAIDATLDGAALDRPPFALFDRDREPEIVVGPRIGITKAADVPWRFCIAGSRFLSRPAG